MKWPLMLKSTHEAEMAEQFNRQTRALKAREVAHEEERAAFRKLIKRAEVFQARGHYPSTRSGDDSFVIQVGVSSHLLHHMMDNDQTLARVMLKEFADAGYQMLMAMCGLRKVPTIPERGDWVRYPEERG